MSPNVMSSIEPTVQFRTRSWIDAAIKLMNRTGPHELVDRVPLTHPHRERGARAVRDLKLVDGDIPVTQLGDRAGVVVHLVHQDRVGALQVTRQQNRWAWLTDTQTRHGGSHGADFPGQLRTHRLDIAQNLAIDISGGYVDVVQRTKHGPSPRQVRTHAGFSGKAGSREAPAQKRSTRLERGHHPYTT